MTDQLQFCPHDEPIRFAAQNLLLPDDQKDKRYCGCCGGWLGSDPAKHTGRCERCPK